MHKPTANRFSELEFGGTCEPSPGDAGAGSNALSFAVVIPAFNEQHTIAEVITRARKFASAIIVVEDGSQDNTRNVLGALPVSIVRHDQNRGKAASLISEFDEAIRANVDAVITLDADLQHAPEDIPRLAARTLDATFPRNLERHDGPMGDARMSPETPPSSLACDLGDEWPATATPLLLRRRLVSYTVPAARAGDRMLVQ